MAKVKMVTTTTLNDALDVGFIINRWEKLVKCQRCARKVLPRAAAHAEVWTDSEHPGPRVVVWCSPGCQFGWSEQERRHMMWAERKRKEWFQEKEAR